MGCVGKIGNWGAVGGRQAEVAELPESAAGCRCSTAKWCALIDPVGGIDGHAPAAKLAVFAVWKVPETKGPWGAQRAAAPASAMDSVGAAIKPVTAAFLR